MSKPKDTTSIKYLLTINNPLKKRALTRTDEPEDVMTNDSHLDNKSDSGTEHHANDESDGDSVNDTDGTSDSISTIAYDPETIKLIIEAMSDVEYYCFMEEVGGEQNTHSGDVTITIPRTLLQNIYHVSSRLETVQDLLSWLIHLLEGQGVAPYPQDDNDTLPEPPDDYMTAPSVCEGCPNYSALIICDVCVDLPGDCEDCQHNNASSVCEACLGLAQL